jgi:hypothetical protein
MTSDLHELDILQLANRLNGEKFRTAVARRLLNCDDLRRCLANNTGSLVDYGEHYRSKRPISTSRAEGRVDETANAGMTKKQRMRWSPQGAHSVAVLDGHPSAPMDYPLAAWRTGVFPLPNLNEIA